MNELCKKRCGTFQMSEQFGPNFAPGSFALKQSIRLVYTLRALSRGRTAQPGQRGTTRCTHTERAHTRSATETQHNSQPETPKGSWPLLLLLLCCCCAAAVLLLCCCCFSTRDGSRCTTTSQQTVFRFAFYGTHAGASNGTAAAAAVVATAAAAAAEQQQQQVQQQGRPKHTYEYTTRHQAG